MGAVWSRRHAKATGMLVTGGRSGKKRHLLVDTLGLLLHAIVHCAGIRDRDGGILLLATMKGLFPFLEKLFADTAYQGPIFANGLSKILPRLETQTGKRSAHAQGSVQVPHVWSR